MRLAKYPRVIPRLIVLLSATISSLSTHAQSPAASDWPNYGNDPGGTRYSPLTQINRENVTNLKVAWFFHTGDISDGSGGVYFSFNYPPAVRHYARDGRLLTEFKPESDIAIMGTPQISSRKQGNQLSVISRYQIMVLDLGLDARGRLLMLLSGENKFEALTHGSRSLLLTNRMGKTLANFDLADGPFNRLTTAGGLVYMLKNHSPIRLDKVVLP